MVQQESLSMIQISVNIQKPLLRQLNTLVKQKRVPSVAEAIRLAIKDYLNFEYPTAQWIAEAVGA